MVLIAVGLGLITGRIVDNLDIKGLDHIGVPAFICLFIGIALLTYHQMVKKETNS